jgi:uncharacterized phage-associated protein
MFNGLYDETRAAQVVAYMLHLGGGQLDLLKLTKLCYLAEKHSYAELGEPLTGDRMASLEHGPILGDTYDKTKRIHPEGVWAAWLRKREGNTIGLSHALADPREELDALSRADFKVIEEVWAKFGHMSGSGLRNWTHDPKNCPEWDDPGKSSNPIRSETLFKSIGC